MSIAAPKAWVQLDAGDIDMSADEFAAAFPDAPAEMVEQGVTMFAQGAVLVGFDFTNPTFASNVSVIDIPGEAPLGVAEDQARQQIESLGGEVLESGTVELTLGEAARLEYTLEWPSPTVRPHRPVGCSSTCRSTAGRTSSRSPATRTWPSWPTRCSRRSALADRRQGASRSLDRASHMSVLSWSDVTSIRSSSPWNIVP